jgi:hypothetical protein
LDEISTTIPFLMNFDIERMCKSKKALRDQLATRPITDKLRMLDQLRERALTIRAAKSPQSPMVRETPPPDYGTKS